MRQHGTHQRGRPEEVQVHEIAQLAVARLLHGPDQPHPRVVDDHVDPAVPEHRVRHDVRDARRIGDIQLHGDGTVGMSGHQVVQRLRPAGRGDDGVPGREGGGGDRPAESGRGPRDEPDPARNVVADCCCVLGVHVQLHFSKGLLR